MISKFISITFSEAILKGGNRRSIENLTIHNVRNALARFGDFKVEKKASRGLLSCKNFDQKQIQKEILKVFGVDSVSFPHSIEPEVDKIREFILSNSADLIGHKIKVETKRADKSFPLMSQELNAVIGKALCENGCSVDLKNPEKTIFIDILPGQALVCFEKIKGFGGIPVGSSGKVLSLLSGGIDSPVSSLLMMKRGCFVDFLHIHNYPTNKDAINSKLFTLTKKINEFSPIKQRLFLAPYTEFYKSTLKIDSKLELVIFRRFLLHLANTLAKKHKYKGVVTGDSLGQVASQTMDNIFATDEAAKIPVFRPLISFNKQEIVDLAMKVGSFDISIKPYKDCCSLVAQKNPSTKVWLPAAKKIEEEINMEKIVEKTLEQIEIVDI
ncbi:MAG: tRNA uracil 4-sulfurtransferase ThiI [Candidatus Micrarchaeota archaeon]